MSRVAAANNASADMPAMRASHAFGMRARADHDGGQGLLDRALATTLREVSAAEPAIDRTSRTNARANRSTQDLPARTAAAPPRPLEVSRNRPDSR
jgi:hypothetical protein